MFRLAPSCMKRSRVRSPQSGAVRIQYARVLVAVVDDAVTGADVVQ